MFRRRLVILFALCLMPLMLLSPLPPALAAPLSADIQAQATRPTIQKGDKGAAVRELQTLLNVWVTRTPAAKLHSLPVNGNFGPQTERSVRAFQSAQKLGADGIVGPKTWAALDAAAAGAPPPAPPSTTPTPPPATQPTPTPPPPATGVPPESTDGQYERDLRARFSTIGGHQLQLQDVSVFRYMAYGDNEAMSVTFEVDVYEWDYLVNNITKAQVHAWGTALLADLKAHFPGYTVSGDLSWIHYTYTPGREYDCKYIGSLSEDGWYVSIDMVSVWYYADQDRDKVKVCRGK